MDGEAVLWMLVGPGDEANPFMYGQRAFSVSYAYLVYMYTIDELHSDGAMSQLRLDLFPRVCLNLTDISLYANKMEESQS